MMLSQIKLLSLQLDSQMHTHTHSKIFFNHLELNICIMKKQQQEEK